MDPTKNPSKIPLQGVRTPPEVSENARGTCGESSRVVDSIGVGVTCQRRGIQLVGSPFAQLEAKT